MTSRWIEAYRETPLGDSEELVRRHLPLVRRVVGRLSIPLPPEIDREDLVEIGILGLLSAAKTYDESRGASFQTFAYVAIRGAILDELRRIDVLPRTRRDGLRSYEEARAALGVELGREPTFLEVQERLGLTLPELEELLRARALADSARNGFGEASTGVAPESFA